MMETIKEPTPVRAIKDHRCDYCNERIPKGDEYMKSTHVQAGHIYDWRAHQHCIDIAESLGMHDHCDDGLTQSDFMESIHEEYFDLMLGAFDTEDIQKYSSVIQQLRHVMFHKKLGHVIRHHKKSTT